MRDIKHHLNIDPFYHDDDPLLCDYGEVAETVVERHIDDSLDDLAKENNGELPAPLRQAMLLYIGNLYANRESIAYANAVELPLSYGYLLQLYQKYNYSNTADTPCKPHCSERE